MPTFNAAAVALCIGLGMCAIFRSAHLLSRGATGRYRLDPWVSLLVGLALMLLGLYLLRHSAASPDAFVQGALDRAGPA